MDGLTLKITNGNRKAIALAKTLVTTPTLINTDIRQGAVYALPLKVETNQQSASAEVSESLVISIDTKKNVSDNVAPGSINYHLTGYIKGIPQLEPSNYFQPFVQLHTKMLWNWFKHGAVLVYKDGNAEIHKQVVIKDLQTAQQKDSANGTPFTMVLKEINVMSTSAVENAAESINDANKLKLSSPTVGSALGLEATLGMTSAEIVEIAEQTA